MSGLPHRLDVVSNGDIAFGFHSKSAISRFAGR